MKLENKVAVVTGGNSGLGLAISHRLAAEGAKLTVFGRDDETLKSAQAEIDGEVLPVRGDVRKLDDLDRLFRATEQAFGGIDVLVVNAGIVAVAPVEATDEELFDSLCDINFKGAFFTIQKALPFLRDGASVVITSSAAGNRGLANTSVYSATKGAMLALARSLSTELAGRRIRVNTVSPGASETSIFARAGMSTEEIGALAGKLVSETPATRLGMPDDTAAAVAFLASDESAFVVGTDLAVDGGWSSASA